MSNYKKWKNGEDTPVDYDPLNDYLAEHNMPAQKGSVLAEAIERELTDEDIAAWHDGTMTKSVKKMMKEFGVQQLQIFGSRARGESLSVIAK